MSVEKYFQTKQYKVNDSPEGDVDGFYMVFGGGREGCDDSDINKCFSDRRNVGLDATSVTWLPPWRKTAGYKRLVHSLTKTDKGEEFLIRGEVGTSTSGSLMSV